MTIEGCATKSGGVGIDLTHQNVILDMRPDTAAARAAEAGTGLQVISSWLLPLLHRLLLPRPQPLSTPLISSAPHAMHTLLHGATWQVGDRVLVVDGITLDGRVLTAVIQPADTHTFEV